MAAQQIGSRDPPSEIKLAKVDATEEPDLAKRFDVGGYPTLKFFKNHATEGLEYGGGRTKDEIISWLDKKSGPPAHAINGKYITRTVRRQGWFGERAGTAFTTFSRC